MIHVVMKETHSEKSHFFILCKDGISAFWYVRPGYVLTLIEIYEEFIHNCQSAYDD